MRELPILFSTPMVQAIQKLLKNMTRRLNNLQDINKEPNDWIFIKMDFNPKGQFGAFFYNKMSPGWIQFVKCPWQPGDRLYVKEAIKRIDWADGIPGIAYVADNEPVWDMTRPCQWVWKNKSLPSMFMPKSIARIWLEVVEVRVERLQDINGYEAIMEGIDVSDVPQYTTFHHINEAKRRFVTLWNNINQKRGYGWDINPWIWVVEFKWVKA